MQEEVFQFKKFIIHQDSASVFKVNTEAVLLAAWTNLSDVKKVLEIGSGTGLISIGLVQRFQNTPAITAIDIDVNAYRLTQKNIEINSIDYIRAIHSCLESFSRNYTDKFDLIISNPPYFTTTVQSVQPRNLYAKYTDSLNFNSLLCQTESLLTENGRFSVIIPYLESSQFITIAQGYNLYPLRRCDLITLEGKKPKRTLLEFSRNQVKELVQNCITVKSKENQFTQEYIEWTKDYYTIF